MEQEAYPRLWLQRIPRAAAPMRFLRWLPAAGIHPPASPNGGATSTMCGLDLLNADHSTPEYIAWSGRLCDAIVRTVFHDVPSVVDNVCMRFPLQAVDQKEFQEAPSPPPPPPRRIFCKPLSNLCRLLDPPHREQYAKATVDRGEETDPQGADTPRASRGSSS
jgi:hypothetical protein